MSERKDRKYVAARTHPDPSKGRIVFLPDCKKGETYYCLDFNVCKTELQLVERAKPGGEPYLRHRPNQFSNECVMKTFSEGERHCLAKNCLASIVDHSPEEILFEYVSPLGVTKKETITEIMLGFASVEYGVNGGEKYFNEKIRPDVLVSSDYTSLGFEVNSGNSLDNERLRNYSDSRLNLIEVRAQNVIDAFLKIQDQKGDKVTRKIVLKSFNRQMVPSEEDLRKLLGRKEIEVKSLRAENVQLKYEGLKKLDLHKQEVERIRSCYEKGLEEKDQEITRRGSRIVELKQTNASLHEDSAELQEKNAGLQEKNEELHKENQRLNKIKRATDKEMSGIWRDNRRLIGEVEGLKKKVRGSEALTTNWVKSPQRSSYRIHRRVRDSRREIRSL